MAKVIKEQISFFDIELPPINEIQNTPENTPKQSTEQSTNTIYVRQISIGVFSNNYL